MRRGLDSILSTTGSDPSATEERIAGTWSQLSSLSVFGLSIAELSRVDGVGDSDAGFPAASVLGVGHSSDGTS